LNHSILFLTAFFFFLGNFAFAKDQTLPAPKFSPLTRGNPAYQNDGVVPKPSDVVIAIIDSGVDYNHERIKEHLWRNPNESEGTEDLDHNGYPGDIHGWDFKENDDKPYDLYSSMAPDIIKSIKFSLGDYQKQFKNLFLVLAPENGGHGTHVAGIAQKVSGTALIMPLRIDYGLKGGAFFSQVN
jgi:subtilisin family serine protease